MSRLESKYLDNKLAITQVLTTDLADAGTLAFNLPTGFSSNSFLLGNRHELEINGTLLTAPEDFTIAFATTVATITNRTGAAFLTGQTATLYPDTDGNIVNVFDNGGDNQVILLTTCPVQLMKIDIGQPIVADVDAIVDAVTADVDGVLAIETNTAGLTFTMDTPVGRNITGDSSSASDDTTLAIRVVGQDTDFQPQTEEIAMNGTTAVAGVKAFSSVESVTFFTVATGAVAASTGAIDVGFGDIFGLPIRLNNEVHQIEREFIDNTIVTTGTFVVGSLVPETNTSPDKRGTFLPATAADSSNTYTIYMWMVDVNDGGLYKPEDQSRHNDGSGVS